MKIAINGAGVAGPALAFWLCQCGHEPTLIEKAAALRTGGYMIDFWGVGYTVAERMGILPGVLEAGYSIQELRLVNRRGRRVGGFNAKVFGRIAKGRFTSLPRGDLAQEIYRSVENRMETIFGDSITAIEERESNLRVGFEHSASREFDLVVGADGLHSTIRALVFGPQERVEKHLGYYVAAFQAEGYRPRDELVYVSYTTPGRQAARFALRDGSSMFLLVFGDDRMSVPPPQNAAERKAAVARIFAGAGWECPDILQAMERVDDIYFDRVSQIVMDRWSKGRVALIGDAAACVSLLAGEGTGLAMTEAYVLAGELLRAGDDYGAAFRRYEERLRPLLEKKQKSARNFASAFAPKTAAGVWFRNQVSKLLAVPPIGYLAFERDFRDDFDLPDYAFPKRP